MASGCINKLIISAEGKPVPGLCNNNTVQSLTRLQINEVNGLCALAIIGYRQVFFIVAYNQVQWQVANRNISSDGSQVPPVRKPHSFRFKFSQGLGVRKNTCKDTN